MNRARNYLQAEQPLQALFGCSDVKMPAAAFARFATGSEYDLPSRSSRSERRLVGEVGLEPTKA
jgi:hypothetical protein